MISNFNEMEKSLKRCLKEKVSITTATVVGFLIAGTVALGATTYNTKSFTDVINRKNLFDTTEPTIINRESKKEELTFKDTETSETYIRTNNSDITLKGTIHSKGTTVELNNKDGNIWDEIIDAGSNILTNQAHIYGKIGIGVVNEIQNVGSGTGYNVREVRIINNGKITASFQGIFNGDVAKYNKTYIENAEGGEIVVNDFERTTSGDKPYYYNTGIYSASVPQTETPGKVINNGKVTIDLTEHQTELKEKYQDTVGEMYINIHGLRLNEHTWGYNNGTILVNSFGGVGVVLSNGQSGANNFKGKYGYFENNGTIEVNGDKGIGLQLSTSGEINAAKEAINTKEGNIIVSGESVTGVKVDGATTTFTNDGTITLKDGVTNGTGISVNKGTATNNGTIALGIGTIENSNKNIAIANTEGTAKNTGKIQITDKTSEELKGFDISTLFNGNYINSGMLVDKNGIAIEKENDVEITGDVNTGDINNAGNPESSIVIKGDTTISGSDTAIEVESLNVTGDVTIANGSEGNKPVEIKGTTTNLDANGSLAIGGDSKADLAITNGTVNGAAGKTAVTFDNQESTLTLEGTSFNGNIGASTDNGTLKTAGTEKATIITGDVKAKSLELAGTTEITGDIETKSMAVTAGTTAIAGTIKGAESINIGSVTKKLSFRTAAVPSNGTGNVTVTYSADSAIKGNSVPVQTSSTFVSTPVVTTVTIGADGILQAQVDNDGNNLFGNSENVKVTGDGRIQFLASNLSAENIKLKFGDNVNIADVSNIITDSKFYSYNDGNLTYDFNVNNRILADISRKSFLVNDVLSQDADERGAQLDNVYSNNVYSETVKMAMDTLRMNEDAVLSLGGKPEEGRWTAQGKMLFSRTEYDRTGAVRNYGVETKTAGLLGALEYGVSEKSSVGFAFSGSKQDLDMKNASADGEAFYFGIYGKQDVNNFKLTAGLGYQLDKIDADNNVISSTGDKYDSKAFSGYAQGKYVINAGNDVTVEPKLKLALTRLTQESAKDKHFEMEKAEATTFDTEVGVDLVKTVKLESGKMNLLAGISYTRSMGDTDNKFKGNFVSKAGEKGERFDVLGANLGENTLKINIGAEIEKDNGFFYNGGLNYKFDNEDRETFGATIGAGYKF